MTLREFDALAERWQEGQHLTDLHFATLLRQTANLNRDPKHKPYPVEDFLLLDAAPAPAPAPPAPKPPQTVEDMKRFALAMTTGLGGKITYKEPD